MKDNNHALFSRSMKMADIVLQNYSLLSMLPRFDIQLGFGESSLADVCRRYGINENFFLLICNVYTFRDYLPADDELSKLDIGSLITYLQRSHKYYIEDKITTIEQKLDSMGECCPGNHHQIVCRFFDEYKREVINHFDYEEHTVFPYIRSLVDRGSDADFNIKQYEHNHSNIEDKLSDLKNIIIKYLPESCASKERNEVLLEIFMLEEDLNRHSLIEDKVLVPFVLKMESCDGK